MLRRGDAATLLAARFGRLISTWNGEPDKKIETQARILNTLCRSVVQLQRTMHGARQESLEMERLGEEQLKKEHEEEKRRLVAPFFGMVKLPVMAELFGGGEMGWNIAKYVMEVQNNNLDAKLESCPKEELGGVEAKTGKRPRKGTNNWTKADKPLQDNTMEAADEDESIEAESDPVKPSPTDAIAMAPLNTDTENGSTHAPPVDL